MSRHFLCVALAAVLLAVPADAQTPQNTLEAQAIAKARQQRAEDDARLSAQAAQQAAQLAPPVFASERQAQEARQQLRAVMRQYPPSVWQVLQLDHTLLSRPDYLAPYPTLRAFLAQHPEITRNPEYYFGQYEEVEAPSVAGEVRAIMWGFSVVAIVATVLGVLAWIIRQLIDYRRWQRAAAVQKEMQSKLMDRLTSSQELLAYLESPAGRRVLDVGVAPMDAPAPQRVAAPVNRILWAVQVGVVLIVVGLAVAGFFPGASDSDAVRAFRFLGSVVAALGAGFVLSALVSWMLSIRLGLMGRTQSQS
jgi:ABC-type multidrug transport system fused ATPase/permease subunit